MKRKSEIFRWSIVMMIAALAGFYYGCGSVSNESSGGDGSSSTTVGGTTVVGTNRTLNVTSNRNTIKVGDQALVTIRVSCSSSLSSDCIINSGGNLVFAALPTEFQTSDGATQSDLNIIANYATSAETTISQTTDTFTLAGGTRADSTASPPSSVIPGTTASVINFTVTLTGTSTGSSVFTAQSLDSIASIVVDVLANTTSPITGN
jgi:hypothetical protein